MAQTKQRGQPPEGLLIEQAREARKLSQREAARLAGMSHTRWRHLVAGERPSWPDHSGEPVRIVGTAKVIARMAIVVQLDVEDFQKIRPDVSAELIRLGILDAANKSSDFGPARLAEMLTEIEEAFGSDMFHTALSLLPPRTTSVERSTTARWPRRTRR